MNALTSGIVAGLVRTLHGDDFRPAFVRGALGGGIAYSGRALATADVDGAGLLGRQLSALGASVARNTLEGRPSLERLAFLVGPLHLYLDRSGDAAEWNLRIDPVEALVAATVWSRPDTRMDWGASLSAGAFVLRSSTQLYGDRSIRGSQRSGVILLADDGRGDPEAAFRHERVHVLQRDFTFQAWGAPLQDGLFGRDPLYRSLTRFLDVDAILPLTEWLLLDALGIPYRDRPREIEAELLSR